MANLKERIIKVLTKEKNKRMFMDEPYNNRKTTLYEELQKAEDDGFVLTSIKEKKDIPVITKKGVLIKRYACIFESKKNSKEYYLNARVMVEDYMELTVKITYNSISQHLKRTGLEEQVEKKLQRDYELECISYKMALEIFKEIKKIDFKYLNEQIKSEEGFFKVNENITFYYSKQEGSFFLKKSKIKKGKETKIFSTEMKIY